MSIKNLKSIILGLLILLSGIVSVLLDLFCIKTVSSLWLNLGCSLIASGAAIIATVFIVDRAKDDPLKPWGIRNIYHTRALMNADCARSMEKAKYAVDIVAFGLSSYRAQDKHTERLLRNGVNFRIITMDTESPFIKQREKEENESNGQIRNTVNQLVKWADAYNRKGYKGKITVKGYNCMTLDFYWRVDDEIYVGAYWYGRGSQQTISYRFGQGDAFTEYTDYFERLWNDEKIMRTLTK